MKIEYIDKQPTKTPTLADLKSGEVFRPKDSHLILMCCDISGESRLLSDCGSDIWGYATFVGSESFENKDDFAENHDYDELIVCANLVTGGVTLFHESIEVERLDCKLVVKEGNKYG